MSPPRLAIDNLSVRIGGIDAVRDVSLSIAPGQIFGVAGESGSGKSMTALAVMGLLPDGALRGGAARLDGEDLFALDEAAMRIRFQVTGGFNGPSNECGQRVLSKIIGVVDGVAAVHKQCGRGRF